MTNATLGAVAVFIGVFAIFGGLKAALWPWIQRRRSWGRRSPE